jgi:hypothetical protein
MGLYRNNLKNRFLTTSALPHNFRSHSSLGLRQWSYPPNENFGAPPCQIPDSSGCFGIVVYEIQGDFEHIFPFWSRKQYRDEHLVKAKTGKDVERT